MSSAESHEKFAADLLAQHRPLLVPDETRCRCREQPDFPPILCSCGGYYGTCDATRWGQSIGLLPTYPPRRQPPADSADRLYWPFYVDTKAERYPELARRMLDLHQPKANELATCASCGNPQLQRTYCTCTAFAARCDYARLARAHDLHPPLPEEHFYALTGAPRR